MAFPWRQWKDQENVPSSGDTSTSCYSWDLFKVFKCVFVEPLTGRVDPPAGTFIDCIVIPRHSRRGWAKNGTLLCLSLFCIFSTYSLPFHSSCAADTFLWHRACQRSAVSFAARPSEADIILQRLLLPLRSFMAPLSWHVWKGCICMVLRAVNRIAGKVSALFGSNLLWLSQWLPSHL